MTYRCRSRRSHGYRKRSALTQKDVACLLGVTSASKVSRYERFTREPGFYTALAYEAIFRRPVSELFPGLYQKIEAEVRARAKTLLEKKHDGKPSHITARRREALAAVASDEAEHQSKRA